MTVSAYELLLYAGGLALLWAVPGPVWVALIARALSGGIAKAWPLALGVAIGDMIWAICAALGLAWIMSLYGGFLEIMRWVASAVFLAMGISLILKPAELPNPDGRLNRPGTLAGIVVGLMVVFGNPKAILFYMGVLPGFFDLGSFTALDIAAIALLSALVPFLGNMGLAVFLDRARRLLSSPKAMQRLNRVSGGLLVFVGLVIPFT
jgi:threonine/homoserine/homoserine lactone efflux protein